MSVIRVENLTFAYPSSYDPVFENVSFQIDTDWKLGFVGRNGRGKTTFLNLLSGKYPYSGKIVSSVLFDYFPYSVQDAYRSTEDVLHSVCPTAEDWQWVRELSCLEVDEARLYQPFYTLSNGEQTKVLLAALFLKEGKFLLIDEPTNHLDTRGRELLSAYLRKKKSFLLVSHDRSFLDGCVDHILSINRSDIEVQSGNFSSFLSNFERRQTFERRQNDRLQTDIRRLQETAKRTERWADMIEKSKNGKLDSGLKPDKGFIGHKSAKMMKRAKAAEVRQQKELEQKVKLLQNTEATDRLKIGPLTYRSERLAVFSSVVPMYNGTGICSPVSLEIMRGERIALEGKNGSGKSSLLKLLCGQPIDHTGEIRTGSGLIISYVPQDTSHLSETLADLAASLETDESILKAALHKMGFDKRQFEKELSDFSDGQKKKALIAASLCRPAHLYVWDEPLNFIDIYTRIQIENLLSEFCPTMIFVEHDRTFQNKIATRVFTL